MTQFQVIVVDDDFETARVAAEYISKRGGVAAVAAATPAKAIEYVRAHPIDVAVLDQKMPEMSGTELYRELKKLRPEIQAIMLSGEAARADVAAALDLKYVADVHKGDTSRLLEHVHNALLIAKTAKLAVISPRKLIGVRRKFIFWVTAKYYLSSIERIGEPSVPEYLWSLDAQISAGQTQKTSFSRQVDSRLIIEEQYKQKLSSSGTVGVGHVLKLEAKMAAELEMHIGVKRERATTHTSSIECTLTLPEEPADPIAPAVKARGFYSGPEFARFRLGIEIDYPGVGISTTEYIEALIHTGYIVGKQEDTLTDGKKLVRLTDRWQSRVNESSEIW